jgi:Protein of unknown function (DUF3306)
MSDEEFLARWSRRKQEAKAGQAKPELEEPDAANGAEPACPAAQPDPPDIDLDPSSLPPIESIDAATDIAAFLRKGIPQELSRAALRRAWATDPAIRDFVGLAENAWDFNDPNAMPGFGPLEYSAEQVDALVRRIVGGVVEAADSLADAHAETTENSDRSADVNTDTVQGPNPAERIADPAPPHEPADPESQPSPAAPQPPVTSGETTFRRRTHGGALPQ